MAELGETERAELAERVAISVLAPMGSDRREWHPDELAAWDADHRSLSSASEAAEMAHRRRSAEAVLALLESEDRLCEPGEIQEFMEEIARDLLESSRLAAERDDARAEVERLRGMLDEEHAERHAPTVGDRSLEVSGDAPSDDEQTIALAEVLYGMDRVVRAEREARPQHQELASCDTVGWLIDRAKSMMLGVVIDTADVLRHRGCTVDADTYDLLKVLPLVYDQMRAGFRAERPFGCADRAKAVLTKMVVEPGSRVELTVSRPEFCDPGSVEFCPEHGWGAHRHEGGDRS